MALGAWLCSRIEIDAIMDGKEGRRCPILTLCLKVLTQKSEIAPDPSFPPVHALYTPIALRARLLLALPSEFSSNATSSAMEN